MATRGSALGARGAAAALRWLVGVAGHCVAATAPAPDPLLGLPRDEAGPGCAIQAVDRTGTRLDLSFGLAQPDAGTRVGVDTRFELGSASKQFVALAVLLLEADGRLRLTDPVGRHLPGLPPALRAPTLEQLMRHTAGLADYVALARLALGPTLAGLDRRRAIEWAAAVPPLFPPGTDFAYSNTGYLLLADVIEAASGLDAATFLQRRIFEPLGMADTQAMQADRPSPRRAAYVSARDGTVRDAEWRSAEGLGAWGVRSSLRDLVRFHRAVLDEAPPLRAVLRSMTRPGILPGGAPVTYAAGLYVGRYRGALAVRHAGRGNVEFLRLPEFGAAVVVLCTQEDADAESLAERVADAAFGDRLDPPAAIARTAQHPGLPGDYVSAQGARFTIEDHRGDLALRHWGPMHRLADGQLTAGPATDALRLLADGQRVRATFHSGQPVALTRVAPHAPAAQAMRRLQGSYVHVALQTVLRIDAPPQGPAMLVHADGRREPLEPVQPGLFAAGALRLRVHAQGAGPVGAIELASARLPALRFSRVRDAAARPTSAVDLLPDAHQVPVFVDDGELAHAPGLVLQGVHARNAATGQAGPAEPPEYLVHRTHPHIAAGERLLRPQAGMGEEVDLHRALRDDGIARGHDLALEAEPAVERERLVQRPAGQYGNGEVVGLHGKASEAWRVGQGVRKTLRRNRAPGTRSCPRPASGRPDVHRRGTAG